MKCSSHLRSELIVNRAKFYQKLEKASISYILRQKILSDILKNRKFSTSWDAGCGSGALSPIIIEHTEKYLLLTDLVPEAVKNAHASVRYAHPSLKIDAYALDLTDIANYPSTSFDLIVCWAVLEHIKDDSIVLKALFSRLNRGGLLVINVPLYEIFFNKLDVIEGHFRRYNPCSIINLIKKTGASCYKFFKFGSVMLLLAKIFWPYSISREEKLTSNMKKLSFGLKIAAMVDYLLYRLNFPFGIEGVLILRKH